MIAVITVIALIVHLPVGGIHYICMEQRVVRARPCNRHGERRLELRLVHAREQATRIVRPHVRRQVGVLLSGAVRVLAAKQALGRVPDGAAERDLQHVLGLREQRLLHPNHVDRFLRYPTGAQHFDRFAAEYKKNVTPVLS